MVTGIIIFLHWFIFVSLILIELYGYNAKVIKTLGGYGLDDIEKGLLANQFKQIQEYKRVCVEKNYHLVDTNFL